MRRPFSLLAPLPLLIVLPVLLAGGFWPAPALAQNDPLSRSWNQPVEPFRIAGNLYYVGASDITSYLITTPEGHILLDGGFEETAPLIAQNVKKLGFRMRDVKILLNTHGHFDHAGGLAALKAMSRRGKLVLMEQDAPLLARGGKGDFRFGDELAYPPVEADRRVRDGDTVRLGGTEMTAHLTPGHTRGNTTWTMRVKDGGKSYDVVFVGSATINPGVVLTDNPKYPEIAADYARSFAVLKKLPCDIFLAAHGSFFGLQEKIGRMKEAGAGENPFVDPAGYREHVRQKEEAYLKQVAHEKAEKEAKEKAEKKAAAPPPGR